MPKDNDELKKIYLVLAKLMHPDNKQSGIGSKSNFQNLQDSYEKLYSVLKAGGDLSNPNVENFHKDN